MQRARYRPYCVTSSSTRYIDPKGTLLSCFVEVLPPDFLDTSRPSKGPSQVSRPSIPPKRPQTRSLTEGGRFSMRDGRPGDLRQQFHSRRIGRELQRSIGFMPLAGGCRPPGAKASLWKLSVSPPEGHIRWWAHYARWAIHLKSLGIFRLCWVETFGAAGASCEAATAQKHGNCDNRRVFPRQPWQTTSG